MHDRLTVWVFQTGEPLHSDGEDVRPMRAMNLSNALMNSGHDIVLWSTAFYHQEKRHRSNKNQTIKLSDNFEIRLIYSRGYKKNIGFARLVDHAQLAFNFKKLLKVEKDLPDVAFIGYPPIESAAVLANWLKKRNIPSLLDIKDQWPEIFIEALPSPLLKAIGSKLFFPYFYFAKSVMSNVTGISSMANGFVDWAVNFSGRERTIYDKVFPLTTPISNINEQEREMARLWWKEINIKEGDGVARICFVGSISPAFDFQPVKEVAQLYEQSGEKIQFIICGEGGASKKVKTMMSGLSNVVFPGWIDRAKIEFLSTLCFASIAPYVNTKNFILNLPNKIIDSMSLGLPILSPLRGEVEKLINEYSIGLKYSNTKENSLYETIQLLLQDSQLQKTLSKNAKNLYLEQFSYDIVYNSLVSHLEMLAVKEKVVNRLD